MIQNYRHAFRAFNSHFDFCREFLSQPRQVASVVIGSRFPEQRLVVIAEVSQSRFLVELGPGIGGTTRALLQAMNHGATLLAIEWIPSRARQLTTISDSRLLVEEADATKLRRILNNRNLRRPDRIISGIPFSSLKPEVGDRLMTRIYDVLAPGGCFVAYQFRSSIVPPAETYFGPAEAFRECRNIPPLRIYCRSKDQGDHRHPRRIGAALSRRDHSAALPRRNAPIEQLRF